MAALFTRQAAGRVALGDTNAELGMPQVDPRRERMDDSQFQTDYARDVEPRNVHAALFTRQALVKIHTTPAKSAPREDQRSHLDEEVKAELVADKDPDLIRHRPSHHVTSAADVPLLEALAALEHQQWVRWSKNIADTEDLSEDRVDRWEELWGAYSALSEEEKEKDRKEARKVLALLKQQGLSLPTKKASGRLFP